MPSEPDLAWIVGRTSAQNVGCGVLAARLQLCHDDDSVHASMLRKLDAKRSSEGAGTKAQLAHPFRRMTATRCAVRKSLPDLRQPLATAAPAWASVRECPPDTIDGG